MKKLLLFVILTLTAQTIYSQCWNSIYESGYGYNCFKIKIDGTLWSNGDSLLINGQQIGNTGNGYSITTPTKIGTANNWKSVYNGAYHIVAIKNDGTLWAWGSNYFGELGNGTSISNYITPTQIGTANNWKLSACGYGSNLAIKTDGTLWAWGFNNVGQLGDGTTVNKSTPTQIGTESNWSLVSIYHSSGFAIKTDGTLWAWGSNYGGGTTINRSTPTQIGTANNWKTISESGHILALKTDGTLWAWGMNNFGELGNGTTISNYTNPTQIGTANNWKSISGGREHSLAIKTDGTLWAWGLNDYGQLGDGTTVNKSTPIQIGTANNWKLVTAGNWFSTALKADGTLWACGLNDSGQLGDGTTINRNTFTQINCIDLGKEAFDKSSLNLYPNPISSIVNIKVGANIVNQPYTITDAVGKIILNGKLNAEYNTINVEHLSKGVYYIKIANNKASKFIKE